MYYILILILITHEYGLSLTKKEKQNSSYSNNIMALFGLAQIVFGNAKSCDLWK